MLENDTKVIMLQGLKWTDCIVDKILKKFEIGKFIIITALKSILKLVKLQSLVAKRCKMLKM